MLAVELFTCGDELSTVSKNPSKCKQKSSNCKLKSSKCKQKSSNCKQKHSCKQRSSTESRKLPVVSKKAARNPLDPAGQLVVGFLLLFFGGFPQVEKQSDAWRMLQIFFSFFPC